MIEIFNCRRWSTMRFEKFCDVSILLLVVFHSINFFFWTEIRRIYRCFSYFFCNEGALQDVLLKNFPAEINRFPENDINITWKVNKNIEFDIRKKYKTIENEIVWCVPWSFIELPCLELFIRPQKWTTKLNGLIWFWDVCFALVLC